MKKKSLEFILGASLVVGAFGSVLGFEANSNPLRTNEIKDTSFSSYLSVTQKKFGTGPLAYSLSLWTYPGARAAAELSNYQSEKPNEGYNR